METILSLIIGAFLPHFVERLKKVGLQGRQAHLVLAIIMAVLYTGYQIFAPAPLKENVYSFITQASVTAVLVYEFLLKKYYNKNK